MKKTNIYGFFVMLGAIILIAFTQPDILTATPASDDTELGFPEDVMKVLETSCFDCHTSKSKNEDAKEDLNFSTWNDLKNKKKIGKLDAICEVVKEKDMPPKKYLGHYPDRALSEEQIKLICDWVDKEADRLMGSE